MRFIALIVLVLLPATVQAEMPTANSEVKRAISYVPPMRGAPASRIGGGSRGVTDVATIFALAPDHTGWTISEQPALYWYISKPMTAHLEVTLINDREIKPVVEKIFDAPAKAGIQKIKLSDFGVKLQLGVEYRWHVSVIVDESARSNDVIASGTIMRASASDELKAELSHSGKTDLPYIYAEAGLWYDALTSISDLIEEYPENQSLRVHRRELLALVGLIGVE